MALTNLAWLRKLLEDDPVSEHETSTANGVDDRVYWVSNPPVLAESVVVYVAGKQLTATTEYTVEDDRRIVLKAPPAENDRVQIEYQRQTWGDEELNFYLEQGALDWTADRHVVYRALIYAIDTLLMGAATGVTFGSGSEVYDFGELFSRLTQRKEVAEKFLEKQEEEGELVIQDMVFDVDDPEYPGDWQNLGSFSLATEEP